jgi:hypothetical protein
MLFLFLVFHPLGWVCLAFMLWLACMLSDPID